MMKWPTPKSLVKSAFVLVGLAGAIIAPAGAPALAAPLPTGQRMAVPAYFSPGPIWDKMEAAAPRVRLAIVNPNSGPNTAADPKYAQQIAEAQKHGLIVVGYVDTNYGKRAAATVEDECSRYFRWYHVDGIFFDEVASGPDQLPYYRKLHGYVHGLGPKMLIVLNPGTTCDEGYMSVGDIICTWETAYSDYINKFQGLTWADKYPARRFWHIVYAVPTVADMQNVVRLSKKRHAGWVYVTSFGANNANPYADLPADPYWSSELAALAGR